ncbi:MAG: thioredoxin family protein [Phycisphaerae bacterium]|nr:thioredoxin family protein [Phycisphaerae bacterium]
MARMRPVILLLCGCVVAATGCSKQLPWHSDWKQAMAEASHDRLPVLLMFDASLCPRCWTMDKEVFTDERVREELAGYKLIRLDLLTHGDIAKQYGFTGTPSFVSIARGGRVLDTYAGAMDAPTMVRWLQRSRMNR